MHTITEIVWDIITETPTLLSELTRIMCQEYEPFFSKEHEEIFEMCAYSSQPERLFSYNCRTDGD